MWLSRLNALLSTLSRKNDVRSIFKGCLVILVTVFNLYLVVVVVVLVLVILGRKEPNIRDGRETCNTFHLNSRSPCKREGDLHNPCERATSLLSMSCCAKTNEVFANVRVIKEIFGFEELPPAAIRSLVIPQTALTHSATGTFCVQLSIVIQRNDGLRTHTARRQEERVLGESVGKGFDNFGAVRG
ncbi:hypothetical protein BDY19DRAFT_394709 [Irpex rosettiformis]|uniref:Uncharacterized protein n=1 Tax=Irpex rosettiformis TaxID=378272 RepID=A0ACB8TV62_9APHY|nr:hypothetical protein BDY19DRAFT_394709 [Irpex rosettiformis]